jgi:4-hydroxy-3-methylbut-2-enyl diphosphate reductase
MAIKALAWMVRSFDPPVYCYHAVVHNRLVVERFRQAGVVFVDDIDEVPAGAPVMLSAHGTPPEVERTAPARSSLVVNAVCPLVRKVHHEIKHRAGRGHLVVYAGHQGHDETVGALAVAPGASHLAQRPADVATLPAPDTLAAGGTPVAFLAQTTLSEDEWSAIHDATVARFGEVWLPRRADLCFATTNRQAAVRAMAPRCDAVVVVGSSSSANTGALVKVARAAMADGAVVLRVDGPDDLPADLSGTVGVTAGASAAEEAVERVVARLAPRRGVEAVEVTTEHEYFPPPGDLRELLRARGAEQLLDDDAEVAAGDVLAALVTASTASTASAASTASTH